MTKIRLHYLWTQEDLTDTGNLSKEGPSYLKLSQREVPRPRIISRIMPQRQIPEPIDPAVRDALNALIHDIAVKSKGTLEIKPSHTEGLSTDGLYADPKLPMLNSLANDKILKTEIAHVHPVDNSLHVWLSEADARTVVENGWGQRFPLKFVHPGWVMVYAPVSIDEVSVVEDIIKAGVSWVTGTHYSA
jgi:Family of unknown function (DUF5519)